MRTTALVSTAFASLAFAASSSPLIPDGITDSCSSFLAKLNTDSGTASCTKSLIAATAGFTNSTSSPSSATVTSALDGLCASTAACDGTAIRTQLTLFYTACPAELTGDSPNALVRNAYDVLYMFTPMKAALCTKDTSTNKYCAFSTTSSTTPAASLTSSVSLIKSALSQQVLSSSSLIPNPTTFTKTNVPFLFISPDLPAADLCTACTKAVLSAYTAWEATILFAYGSANSILLGGQNALWTGVSNTCPADFLTTVTKNTGSAPLGGALGGAMSVKASVTTASLVGAIAAGLSMLVM